MTTKRKPSKESVQRIRDDALAELNVIRTRINPKDSIAAEALAGLETFISIAFRVIARTNVSRVIDEMRTVEIITRMGGKAVISD